MCGISGVVVNKLPTSYFDLLRVSEIRGQDGTGICILREGKLLSHHWVCKASEITDLPELRVGDLVIGQNRLAIFGVDHSNDQPLVSDNLAVVHNGNLYDFEKAFQEYGLDRKYRVDTELILRLLELDISTEKFLRAPFTLNPQVKGDYACLVLNKELRTLLAFSRNKPIYTTLERDSNRYFFSTERIGAKVFRDYKYTSDQSDPCNFYRALQQTDELAYWDFTYQSGDLSGELYETKFSKN